MLVSLEKCYSTSKRAHKKARCPSLPFLAPSFFLLLSSRVWRRCAVRVCTKALSSLRLHPSRSESRSALCSPPAPWGRGRPPARPSVRPSVQPLVATVGRPHCGPRCQTHFGVFPAVSSPPPPKRGRVLIMGVQLRRSRSAPRHRGGKEWSGTGRSIILFNCLTLLTPTKFQRQT